jgi:hypothetical protein
LTGFKRNLHRPDLHSGLFHAEDAYGNQAKIFVEAEADGNGFSLSTLGETKRHVQTGSAVQELCRYGILDIEV